MFKNSIVIAAYTKIGSILRNKNRKIQRDRLFFAGGAGSIRGYGYQKVGQVNDDKRPYGGESLFEMGIEPRLRVTEDVGLVAFLEGGNVYSSKMPHFFKKPLFGYGVGMRYYTPLGPIRLDLAFPTKRRKTSNNKRIDSMFNIYISIGQAF
jgi:translocation and assembly module TamA